jgi:hypothetical protein
MTVMNAEVRLTLFQERDMLYGSFDILSGAFPTTDQSFRIKGDVIDGSVLLEIQEVLDDCRQIGSDPCTMFGYRLFTQSINSSTISGDTIYVDRSCRSDSGSFTLDRVGDIYPPE